MPARKVPEYFVTTARKVEPVGGDCIRIYCAIERNGVWEDQFTAVMPYSEALVSARFVADSATEIHNELAMGRAACKHH